MLLHHPGTMALRISALVPTLNEETTVEATLRGLREAGVDQILVADGGSQDGTVRLARPIADRVITAEGGLFAQLNSAADAADGDVFLFHYADVELPGGGREAIQGVLEDGEVVGGAFRLAFASERRRYRLIAGGANLRNRLGIGPFGDQSIFVKADVFRRLGGFRPEVLLGDLHLVRRVKREGRFVILRESVRASVRRWERNGVVPTLLFHAWLTFLYVALGGKSPGAHSRLVRRLRAAR